MNEFDPRWISAVMGVAFVLNMLVLVYVSYSKVEEAEGLLKNCEWIQSNRKDWGGAGPVEHMYRLAMISMVFDFTTLWHKHGLIDLEEVRNFPPPLRRWILIPQYTSYVIIVVGASYWGFRAAT